MSTYTGSFWQLLNPFALLAGVVSSAMITLHGGAYLAHRTEGAIQARAVKGAVAAAIVMVAAFLAAGFWVQTGIEGYRITSVIDPAALPDPWRKTVVREAGAWMANYGRQPLLWALPALGVLGALLAALLLRAGHTLAAFICFVAGRAGRDRHGRCIHVPLHHAFEFHAGREPDGLGQRVQPPARWASCSGSR